VSAQKGKGYELKNDDYEGFTTRESATSNKLMLSESLYGEKEREKVIATVTGGEM
jgi:hypothetical protein